jgi:hypothetical protein
MTTEEFAEWSENALWLHAQKQMIQQANTMSAVGAAFGSKKR